MVKRVHPPKTITRLASRWRYSICTRMMDNGIPGARNMEFTQGKEGNDPEKKREIIGELGGLPHLPWVNDGQGWPA